MCGIAGFVDPSDHDASRIMDAMLGAIYHRGPDGEGSFVSRDASFAVGMRRLSIIDLQTGDQPIWNETKNIGVVFNGEIYNYKELTAALSARGHTFRTHSDTEVLVHLYEEYGDDMVGHLRGMFAFCIFDLDRRVLFFARDYFGQKPLYYTKNGPRFGFASEIKALLALPWVDRQLDRDAFLDYVCWLSLPPPRTHYRNIWKLPAGCCARLSIDTNDLAIRRFWQLDQSPSPDLTSEEEAYARLDETLADSISKHLRADVPIGILLSSGLDSFAILSYAQKELGSAVNTFSVGFGNADSELEGAAKAAHEAKSLHHQLELTVDDFAASIDKALYLLDEPIGDPACFAVLRLCELARGHVKVLLSGEGSDELFAGYEARYLGALDTLNRSEPLRRLGALLPAPNSPWESSRWQRLLARAHSTAGGELVNLRSEGFPGDVRHPRGLKDDQRNRLFERSRMISRDSFRVQPDRLGSLLAFDVDWQLPESLLQKADKMSMGASIELRAPFLDIEVAKLATRIPSHLKLPKTGPGKQVLRRMLASRFPSRTVPVVKKGFPIPLREWMTGPLREQIQAELFSSRSSILQQLDGGLLRKAWDDFLGGWDGGRVFYSLWLYEKWVKGKSDTRNPSLTGSAAQSHFPILSEVQPSA
jgi:asparagine synthase (glutamine-hydrolysing)